MATRKFDDLANAIRRDILSGRYGMEGGLPEIREIALRHGVAKNTVITALSNLEGQGLIEKRGHSYYVNQLSVLMTESVPHLEMRSLRDAYYENVGTVEETFVPEHLALKFKVPSDTKAIYRVQVSGENAGGKKPLKVTSRYHLIPLSSAEIQRMADEPAYDPLSHKEEYATRLYSSDEVVPRLATEEERMLLLLPENTPVTHLFEIIVRGDETLMIQEIVLSPRETLVFAFPFDNKHV